MKIFAKGTAGAFARFHLMANLSGAMSLLLWFVYMPVKIAAHNGEVAAIYKYIAMFHGFIYPIYVIATFHFCLAVRKKFGSMIGYLLAGTLPFASLVLDYRMKKEYSNLV